MKRDNERATHGSGQLAAPLLPIALGFSSAWIENLTVLEPYRPISIGAAFVALLFAYRRIWRQATAALVVLVTPAWTAPKTVFSVPKKFSIGAL